MSLIPSARQALASSSRCRLHLTARSLSTTRTTSNVMSEIDKQLNSREVIERKRKAFEEKYGDKLQKRVESEGVPNLDALKSKVLAPSVKQALKAKKDVKMYQAEKAEKALVEDPVEEAEDQAMRAKQDQEAAEVKKRRAEQAKSDRSGVKPLGEIINLPLLHMTPHDRDAIAKIWTAYHTTHPTLSSGFLSAYLTSSVYTKMLETAKANPFFVLPLPRPASSDSEAGQVLTDSYEMFYLQWLFHPTSSTALPPLPDGTTKPLPLTSSIIFTPLEEFKRSGEWAQPYLVMTHYPEMSHSHDLVLMRGEITAASAGGPAGSEGNPGFMLSQQQAQLLALALQKFYCTGVAVPNEDERGRKEREKRAETLVAFRERPQEWDWKGLVEMAYGGMV